MHPSALNNAKLFFDTYAPFFESNGSSIRVVEIGSQDVNGSIRQFCPNAFEYIGVDFVAGQGVDVVIPSPYKLPFEDDSVDIVVSSSCFEHSEMFWVVYLEIMRILKPEGVFYLNAPSNGMFHRYPVDCWRFYPDSGQALVAWAKFNGVDAVLLESYVSNQMGGELENWWNDFVAVFVKNRYYKERYAKRILHNDVMYTNGVLDHLPLGEFLNLEVQTEDHRERMNGVQSSQIDQLIACLKDKLGQQLVDVTKEVGVLEVKLAESDKIIAGLTDSIHQLMNSQ